MRRLILPFLPLAALPAAGYAQWHVVPQAGYIAFDEGTALKGMPVAGLEIVRNAGGLLAFGLSFDFARGQVDGAKFPLAELNFGVDSTVFAVIHQPIAVLSYGARVEISRRTGGLDPFLGIGIGGYSMFLDAQQWDAPVTRSGPQLAVGGGIRLRASEQIVLSLDARDVIYPDFEPEQLYPVREENRNDRFPELNPPPLEPGTMHNLRLTIGLRITPTGRAQ